MIAPHFSTNIGTTTFCLGTTKVEKGHRNRVNKCRDEIHRLKQIKTWEETMKPANAFAPQFATIQVKERIVRSPFCIHQIDSNEIWRRTKAGEAMKSVRFCSPFFNNLELTPILRTIRLRDYPKFIIACKEKVIHSKWRTRLISTTESAAANCKIVPNL